MAVVYLNGQYVAENEAQVSIYDRGFMFGDGVYEVIPVYQGKCFRELEHLERLHHSLAAVQIDNPYSDAEWQAIFAELITKNGSGTQKLYMQVTRGAPSERDHRFPDNTPPTVLVMSKPLAAPSTLSLEEKAAAAVIREDNRWQHCDVKSISLLANVLLGHEATAENAAETLLIRDECITEGASSNVFIVMDGVIRTAPKGPQILGGITRDLIVELIEEAGLPFVEQAVPADQIEDAEEIWISSSTREIVPITMLDNQAVGKGETVGKPGPLTRQAAELYSSYKQTFTSN